MSFKKEYFAHGKLLITGEYAVLDGAKALAIPTKMGQRLTVSKNTSDTLYWKSYDVNNQVWFECSLSSSFQILETSSTEKCQRLIDLLTSIIMLKPEFSLELFNSNVITQLEFDRNWGLGSSSTLIHLISQWSEVNPYRLLKDSFTGSGYDIACADAKGPILYYLENKVPQVKEIPFNPVFKNQIFFVYTGNKQFSDQEINKYSKLNIEKEQFAQEITQITSNVVMATNLKDFTTELLNHENLVSKTLNYPKIKDQYFKSINGTFKSLGAWGGDFVMFVGEKKEIPKIKKLGFQTIMEWKEMF
ncbi:MAG: GYDIA family GHMP kinase [Salibacteraceae bacterium]